MPSFLINISSSIFNSLPHPPVNMMFKLSTVAFAAFGAVFLLAGQVSALADNPGTSFTVIAFDNATDASLFGVDACNGSNHYGEGHSCSYKSADGQVDGCK